MVTTTHDPELGGAPRLIVCFGGDGAVSVEDADDQQTFALLPGITRLGTGSDADIRLEGTAEELAEIRHDEFDEYVYVQKSGHVVATVNGAAVSRRPLRTGDRLELGAWTLMYFREEYADHGRPHGGRQGGEGAHQESQPARSEMTPASDPGPQDLQTVHGTEGPVLVEE